MTYSPSDAIKQGAKPAGLLARRYLNRLQHNPVTELELALAQLRAAIPQKPGG